MKRLLACLLRVGVVGCGKSEPAKEISSNEAGLEHVKELSNLETLSLTGPQFSNKVLEHLAGLENMKNLSLYQSTLRDTNSPGSDWNNVVFDFFEAQLPYAYKLQSGQMCSIEAYLVSATWYSPSNHCRFA